MLDKLKKVIFGQEQKDIPPAYSPTIDVIWPNLVEPQKSPDESLQTFTSLVQKYGTSYIYACVNKLANAVRLYKPKVAKKLTNGGLQELHDSKVIKLLKNPNTYYGFPTLLEATAISLALTGNAYWEIIKVNNKPIGFFVLQPQRVIILKDKTGKVGGYEYQLPDGKKVTYNPDEIIHFKIYNIQDDYYGLSPLIAAGLPDSILKDVNKFLQNYFKQGGVFRGVLETEKQLTKPIYDRLTERFKRLYTGLGNAFVIPILEGGLKFKPVQVLPKDSQAFESATLALQTLFAVFQVHPALLGFEKANHAVLRELRAMYWEDTVVPFVSRIEETLNAQKAKFTPASEMEYDIVFDTSQIEALKVNELLKARIAVGYGALTINEVRSRLFGLPPREGGDIALIPLNMVPTETAIENTPGSPKPKKNIESKKVEKSPVFKTKEEYELYHSLIKILIEEDLLDVFQEQFQQTSKYLEPIYTSSNLDKQLIDYKIEQAIDGSFYIVADKISSIVRQKLHNIYFNILTTIDKEKALVAPENEKVLEFADNWSKTLVSIINDTTKRQLIKELQELEPTDDVRQKIYKVFQKLLIPFVGQRLKLISFTEATRLINFAAFVAHKECGFTHKTWKVREWHKSRHKNLHNITIRINEYFDVNGEKALFPADPNLSADQTCNCKCYLVYHREIN